MNSLYAILLAGGSGTRLWPLSREASPKQFISVGGPHSLVRETALRCLPLVDWKNIYVVCGQTHAKRMQENFPELSPSQFLLEPCGRNTAAAIAWAAFTLKQVDPESVMAVLPADHKIAQKEKFQETLCQALDFAKKEERLITLGLVPTFPATGYGYIQKGACLKEGKISLFVAQQFKEKPSLTRAKEYVQSGEYLWNSGMFVWRTQDYWRAYQQYLAQDAKHFESGAPVQDFYPQLQNISVDYALLEKSPQVAVVPAHFDWDDVGNLTSLAKYFEKDERHNAVQGLTVTTEAEGNLLLTDEGVIACLGVKDLLIIRNKDTVLVLPKERSEEVKKILEEIKKKQWHSLL